MRVFLLTVFAQSSRAPLSAPPSYKLILIGGSLEGRVESPARGGSIDGGGGVADAFFFGAIPCRDLWCPSRTDHTPQACVDIQAKHETKPTFCINFLISDIVSRIFMSLNKREIVAQALADQGDVALSAFVTSLDNDHPSLPVVVPPKGLKEYWTTIRSQGLWIYHPIDMQGHWMGWDT